MQREIRKLRTWLGRVMRDVQRKAGEVTGELKQKMETAQRLHAQKRDAKNKLYALHAPEVECIAKGKVRTPYEFGVKVSVAVTAAEGLVVGMRSMPGNPYDGHPVDSQLEEVSVLTGQTPKIVLADRGYRDVEPSSGARLLISHTRRLPKRLKKLLKRRQVVEPMIGHMKADGLLGRNWLHGELGDAMHAILGPQWDVAMQPGKRRKLDLTRKWAQLLDKAEQLKASVRAKVEHPFHVIKNLFRHRKVRYKGLAKNEAQLFALFGLANIVIAQRRLMDLHARGAS